MKKLLDLKIKVFLFILIVYIPFAALISNLLLARTTLSENIIFWAIHWYEPVALILLFVVLVINSIKKKLNCSWAVIASSVLAVFGLVSIFLFSESISRGFEGFRFTLFGLIIFILVSQVDWKELNSKRLINTYLIVSTLIALFAIVERILPLNYWQKIVSEDSTFGWGNFSIVVATQSSSIMQGPNQLASYLLPAVFIVLISLGFSKERELDSKFFRLALFVVFVAAIALTFSRSSLLALLFGLVIYSIISFIKSRESSIVLRIIIPTTLLVLSLGAFYIYQENSAINDYFTHGKSQSEHIEAITDSIIEIKDRVSSPVKLIFGSGLGSAGPAVLKYGNGFVSESWYLQIALELGIVGLVLWLVLIVTITVDEFKQGRFGLFLALIAVSIAALFLHTFADNPAVAITIFILVGTINYNKERTTTDLVH